MNFDIWCFDICYCLRVCVCVSSVRVVWSAGKLGNIFPGLNNSDSPSLSDNSISKLIKTKRADRRFSSCSFSYMFEHFNINFNFRWIIVLGSLSYWGYLRVWEFVEPVCVCFLWTWWKQSVTDCELVGACTTVVFMLALSQTARSDLRQFAAVWLFWVSSSCRMMVVVSPWSGSLLIDLPWLL